MSLWEASIWLGALPLATYAACYWPFLFYAEVSGNPTGLIALHAQMLDLQTQRNGYTECIPPLLVLMTTSLVCGLASILYVIRREKELGRI